MIYHKDDSSNGPPTGYLFDAAGTGLEMEKEKAVVTVSGSHGCVSFRLAEEGRKHIKVAVVWSCEIYAPHKSKTKCIPRH